MSGGLAVGGIAATAMSLLHDLDATVMVLAWTLGATALIVALGGIFGRSIFGWTSPHGSMSESFGSDRRDWC